MNSGLTWYHNAFIFVLCSAFLFCVVLYGLEKEEKMDTYPLAIKSSGTILRTAPLSRTIIFYGNNDSTRITFRLGGTIDIEYEGDVTEAAKTFLERLKNFLENHSDFYVVNKSDCIKNGNIISFKLNEENGK